MLRMLHHCQPPRHRRRAYRARYVVVDIARLWLSLSQRTELVLLQDEAIVSATACMTHDASGRSQRQDGVEHQDGREHQSAEWSLTRRYVYKNIILRPWSLVRYHLSRAHPYLLTSLSSCSVQCPATRSSASTSCAGRPSAILLYTTVHRSFTSIDSHFIPKHV